MISRRHTPGTAIHMRPGTCFVMPTLPYPDLTGAVGGNYHPFIVVNSADEYVECVMARTLSCEAEGKNHRNAEERSETTVEIRNPNPPMNPRSYRRQYTDMQNVMVIPKKVLYDAPNLKICCEGAQNESNPGLPESETNRLVKIFRRLVSQGQIEEYDPFSYFDSDDEYNLPNYSPDPIQERFRQSAKNQALQQNKRPLPPRPVPTGKDDTIQFT